MQNEQQRKAAIARLVASGHMTREDAGVYPDEGYEGELPDYDASVVTQAYPEILEINFDQHESGEWFATLRDGLSDEPTVIELGDSVPKTTEELVECIRKHFREAIDTSSVAETRNLLAAFGDEDDEGDDG